MIPEPIAKQILVDVPQRELPDLADALRRKLLAAALLQDVTRVPDHLHDPLQRLHVLPSLGAEHLADRLEIQAAEVPREEIFLELLQPLHLAHQFDGLAVFERLLSVEEIPVPPTELLEIADVTELLEEVLKIPLRVAILESVLLKLLDRLAEAQRQPVEKLALLVSAFAHLLQGRAFEIDDPVELVAQVVERMVQVELAVTLAHLLAQLLEQIVETDDPRTLPLHSLTQQPVHRLLQVVGEREVLRELFEDLRRRQLDPLTAVPAGESASGTWKRRLRATGYTKALLSSAGAPFAANREHALTAHPMPGTRTERPPVPC